jgi:hypothetical protein
VTLRQKQSVFARLIAHLISHIYARGWEVTLADGHVEKKVGHMAGSLHYIRLAQDLNLFVDGKWIQDGAHPAWAELGEFWEKLNPLCAWGGRFQDANHFSLAHDGKK